MRNPGRRFLIIAAACLLSTARFARAEDVAAKAATPAPAKAAVTETVKAPAPDAAAKTAAPVAVESATEVGAAVCASCHAEQAEGFKKSWHGRKMPAMKKVPFEKSCESCHGPGSLHANAAGDHGNAGYATVKITAAGNERCLSCHNQRSIINWNVSTHNQQGLACAACHKMHTAGENSPKPKSELCMDCHKKQRMQINLPFHHPIIEGKMECASCHNPHGGDFRGLKAESGRELCVKCHAEKAGPYVMEHPPVAEDCSICHMPHGSINTSLLKQGQPMICLTCHKQHHADGSGGGFNSPLTSAGALTQRQTCTDCHFKIHGSDNDKASSTSGFRN